MGVVFLAEHQLLKRPCAIKLIGADSAADPKALARFEREVRTTAQLSHPNTVEIYDYGRTEDGTFYYVMELLHGLSLADLVARHGPVSPGRAIFLIRHLPARWPRHTPAASAPRYQALSPISSPPAAATCTISSSFSISGWCCLRPTPRPPNQAERATLLAPRNTWPRSRQPVSCGLMRGTRSVPRAKRVAYFL